jgi:uncharacterized protein (TIRG00374 family)
MRVIELRKFWQSARRWLPGTTISLVLLGIILYFVDLNAVWSALKKADYRFLLLALLGSIVWFMVRGIVWWTLLQKRATYKITFFCLSEGYLMNNFLPFRLGEVGRAFLLSRKSDLRFMEIIPTIVVERVLDLVFSASILIISVPFVFGVTGADRIGFIVGGIMLAGLVGLFVLANNRIWAGKVFEKLSHRWPKLQMLGSKILDPFLEGLAVLTDLRLFAKFMFWMTINWMIAIAQYFLLVRAFFPEANLPWAMFSLGVAAFGGAIPSLPGAIGTLDAAVGGAITLLTQNIDTAAAFVIVLRLFNYLVTGVPALFALSTEGQTLAGLYRDVTRFRTATTRDNRSE